MKKADTVQKILKLREKASTMYREADELEQELLGISKVGAQTRLPNGRVAVLTDRFRDANSVFCGHFVRQFEFKYVE